MTPLVDEGADRTPFGLAMLGAPTFEPHFRAYRALCADRVACFEAAARRFLDTLAALGTPTLQRLETATRTLWQRTHHATLERLDL